MSNFFQKNLKKVVLVSLTLVGGSVLLAACGTTATSANTDISCDANGSAVTCRVGNGASTTFIVEPEPCTVQGLTFRCNGGDIDLSVIIQQALAGLGGTGGGGAYVAVYGSGFGGLQIPNQVELNTGDTAIEVAVGGFAAGENIAVSLTDSNGNALPLATGQATGSGGSYFGNQVVLPNSVDINVNDPCSCNVFTVSAQGDRGGSAQSLLILTDKQPG